MINEERLCMGCHLPITNMTNAVMVPDNGANQMYHRPCLEAMVGEAPTPDEPRASVRMLPSRPRSDRDFIRIKPLVRAESGRMVHPDELHKSDSSQPLYEATRQCVLCRRVVPDSDAVRSGSHIAHKECVRVLLAFVNEPNDSKQAATSVYPVQVKASGVDVEREKGKEAAKTVLFWMADQIKQGQVG